MSELARIRGLYAIGNIEDWSGSTEYEIAELLGGALDIADQQAARIAELEAALQKIAALAHQPNLATSNLYDIQEYLRTLGYDGESGQ